MFVAKTGDMIVSGVVSAWYAFKNNDMTSWLLITIIM